MILASAGLGLRLGDHALIDPDEGRNALVALEMAASGDYVVPRLNGLPHLDKPVLFYAAGALATQLFGPSELAARLPALIATWATVAVVAWFSAHLFGRRTAWVAGTACATAPLAIAMARTVIFDSMLSFFVVLALMAFYRAVEAQDSSSPWSARRWALLAWAAMAFGVLTKGPVALAVPLLVAAPYAIWRRRSSVVWHPFGALLFLLLVLPWAWAVETQVPGFLRYALVTETWRRLTTGELQRGGPIWYFLPYLIGGCFPWVLLVAAAGRQRWREVSTNERRPLVFLALWTAIPLLFFSLSQSKRPQYILPLVAACALWTAWAWSARLAPVRGFRVAAAGWLLLGGAFLWAAQSHQLLEAGSELANSAAPTALAMGALMLVSGFLAWACSRRPGPALAALSLPLVLLPTITAPLLIDLARTRSGKDLAAALGPHLTPETTIVGIRSFSPSLAFYLGRSIHLSDATGEPLRSNYIVYNAETWMSAADSTLHPLAWWQEALSSCTQPFIFLLKKRHLTERSRLEAAGLPLVFEDQTFVALGPCHPLPELGATENGDS